MATKSQPDSSTAHGFREGDIVRIPLPDGRVAIGWILHISCHFTNAAGLVVLGIEGTARATITDDSVHISAFGPLYTNVLAMLHYGWQTLENHPVSASRFALTKRIVGGHVYVGDDLVGPVNWDEDAGLPRMLLYGMHALWRVVGKAFPSTN